MAEINNISEFETHNAIEEIGGSDDLQDWQTVTSQGEFKPARENDDGFLNDEDDPWLTTSAEESAEDERVDHFENVVDSDAPESESALEVVPQKRTKVAIVGRPNVGKSSLFNLFIGKRAALVKDEPGVTRDIHIRPIDVWGRGFDLVDTGGITEGQVPFADQVRKQVIAILPDVDLLLVVVDGRAGLHPDDREVLKEVQKSKKPFLVLVNKIDSEKDQELLVSDFYELGVDLQGTSFENRRGIDEICEWLISQSPEFLTHNETLQKTIAVIGKPNVGKSSLINYLLNDERMLVSDIAGTTVDAIDSEIDWNGKKYTFIDTAGLRRKAKRSTGVENLSAYKSEDAIARASIVVLMLDGTEGPSRQEARLLELAWEQNKAVLIAINKSDLGRKEIENYRETIQEKMQWEFHFQTDMPRVFISAKTGQGLDQLFEKIDELWEKMHLKISTSDLNDFLGHLTRLTPPPIHGSKNVKFYYFTQTKQVPPSFIAFCNYPPGISDSYKRFLHNELRKKWDLQGVPLRLYVFKKK